MTGLQLLSVQIGNTNDEILRMHVDGASGAGCRLSAMRKNAMDTISGKMEIGIRSRFHAECKSQTDKLQQIAMNVHDAAQRGFSFSHAA